jgi:hypothetical protein
VTGGWRRLHYEELQVKEDEMGTACSTNGEESYAYGILMGKPERKIPPGRPRRKSVVWTGSMWLRIKTSAGLL